MKSSKAHTTGNSESCQTTAIVEGLPTDKYLSVALGRFCIKHPSGTVLIVHLTSFNSHYIINVYKI